jgi:hypothetical protein
MKLGFKMERTVAVAANLFPTGHWALVNPKGAVSDKWVQKLGSGTVLPGEDWFVHEWRDPS